MTLQSELSVGANVLQLEMIDASEKRLAVSTFVYIRGSQPWVHVPQRVDLTNLGGTLQIVKLTNLWQSFCSRLLS